MNKELIKIKLLDVNKKVLEISCLLIEMNEKERLGKNIDAFKNLIESHFIQSSIADIIKEIIDAF